MANDSDDYAEQWVQFLSRGYYYFSKELFTPDIALLVSPDGSKIIVIGDTSGVRCDYHDEQMQVVHVSLCNGGIGNSFNCPACGQFYIITPEGCEQDDDIIFIQKDRYSYDCACGVVFLFEDRYEFVSLPFDLEDLAPLYFAGLSQNADLLVRYVLSKNGRSLVEEICEVRQHTPGDVRLTDQPDFKFEAWTTRPCFITGGFRVQDVRIWRRRVYKLGSDTFEESTYRVAWDSWDTVTRKVGYMCDSYANQRMLEALELLKKAQSRTGDQTREQITKAPSGGDTRAREIRGLWANTDVLKEFARLVDKVWPTWKRIKLNVDWVASGPSGWSQKWLSDMWEDDEIKKFAGSHPKFTREVLARAVDDKLIKLDREPFYLACFHVDLEMEVTINGETLTIHDTYIKYCKKLPAPSTLKNFYDNGKALLNQSE